MLQFHLVEQVHLGAGGAGGSWVGLTRSLRKHYVATTTCTLSLLPLSGLSMLLPLQLHHDSADVAAASVAAIASVTDVSAAADVASVTVAAIASIIVGVDC